MRRYPYLLVCLVPFVAGACGSSAPGGTQHDSGGGTDDGPSLADAQGDGGTHGHDAGSGRDAAADADAGRDGGQAEGGTPSGTYAFVGGAGLSILDVSDPAHITLAGKYAVKGGGITGVNAADAHYAYATAFAGTTHQLLAFDVTDVSKVNLAGSASLTKPATDSDSILSGGYLYVPEEPLLEVFDVSSPSSPKSVGSLTFAQGGPRGMALAGSHIVMAVDYGVGRGGALVVVDISAPTAPALVSTTRTPGMAGGAWGISVDGTHAYLTSLGGVPTGAPDAGQPDAGAPDTGAPDAGAPDAASQAVALLIYDISSLSSPVLVSSLALDAPHGIAAAGGYVYMADPNVPGLVVVDVHDASSPKLASTTTSHSPIEGMALSPDGKHAYAGGGLGVVPWIGAGTLEVFDVTTPSSPTSLGDYTTLPGGVYTAEAVKVVGP